MIRQQANGDPDLAGLGRAEFLDSCRQRYDQARALTLSNLIEDRWGLVEAEREKFDAWRSKTLCAEEMIVPRCSNAPEPEA